MRIGNVAMLSIVVALAACNPLGPSSDTGTLVEQTSPLAESTPGGASTPTAGTPAPSATEEVDPLAPDLEGTPGGEARVEVSPSEVTVGDVVITLSVEQARHMFAQAAPAAGGDPAQQAMPSGGNDPGAATAGSAVFGDGMLKVANNIDQSQSPPADSPQAIVRHIVLEVRQKNGGQRVPYLDPTIDVLLDGRPTIFDQGLAPMVAVDRDRTALYYGNNVKFPQRGVYQVFVRLQRNPLLGLDHPPAAQFNLTIR